MAVSKKVRVIETFPSGTKVKVYAAASPVASFPPGGDPVSSSTVDDDGNVEFKGLENNHQYVVVGEVPEWRQVSFYTNEAVSTPDSVIVTPGTATNPAAQTAEPNIVTGDVQSLEAAGFDVTGPNVDAKPLNPDLPGEPEADPAEPAKVEKAASKSSKSKS